MTPLRQRFVEDLQVRNYAASTIESYTYHVAYFAKYFGRSPDVLGPEDVRTWQVYLVTEKKFPGRCSIKRFAPYGSCTARRCRRTVGRRIHPAVRTAHPAAPLRPAGESQPRCDVLPRVAERAAPHSARCARFSRR